MSGKLVFFFFSSRRRHTRWTGDWSSDVCSSDLHAAHGVAVGADDLREEVAAHEGLAVVFLLGNDLQQDRTRDVPLSLLVDDHKVDALDHQPADVCERDVAAFDRIVQPPVRILLNSARFAHDRSLTMGCCTFLSAGRLHIPYYIGTANPTRKNDPPSLRHG